MLKLVTQLKQTTQLKWNGVDRFKPMIQFEIEVGAYIVKTADSVAELLKLFRLRHEVFHQEFRDIQRQGLDIDKYDRIFDHLIIYHKPSAQIIGTYRLRTSADPMKSYTSQEFDLSGLKRLPGPYLELGRACIHQEHRKGAVMSLLFRGIAEYMNRSGAQILFGCSSVKITHPREAALIHKYLQTEEVLREDLGIEPTAAFTMSGFEAWLDRFAAPLSEEQRNEAEALLPSLVKSYLKMGAMIACEPAYDEDFACVDLLTLLRLKDLANPLVRRFQVVR